MPRRPADAFFAFFICCPCCTDVVLQNRHVVASEGALEFAASAAVAPAERAALSTVAAASRARKQYFTLSIRCRVSHSGSILKIQRKAPRFAPVAAAAKTMRALRRSGAYRMEIYSKE